MLAASQALVYAGTAPDAGVPPATLPKALASAPHLIGLRLGIFRPWFMHAEQDVVAACWAAVQCLERLGAEVLSSARQCCSFA